MMTDVIVPKTIIFSPQAGGQSKFLSKLYVNEVLFGGAAGPGKQISLDALIVTPYGFTTMGAINIGDEVITDKGTITKVIAKTDIDYNPDAYEIEFDTGAKVKCDARHLWKTYTAEDREKFHRRGDEFREKRRADRESRAILNPKNKGSQKAITLRNKQREYDYLDLPKPQIRTTAELYNTQKHRTTRINHSIDTVIIEGSTKELPIAPYLLGLWLGDGYSRDGNIAMENADFVNCFKTMPNESVAKSKIDVSKQCLFTNNRVNGLRENLKKENLINNKHIPNIYFGSSVNQRIALLQGIMDTDGYCSKSGDLELTFSVKYEPLFNDFVRLIASLGVKINKIKDKTIVLDGKNHYAKRIRFNANFQCFRLERKAERQNFSEKNKQSNKYYIKSITKIPPEPMQCITVADESGMYLITNSNIATHNSWGLVFDALGTQYNFTPLKMSAYEHKEYRAVLFRRKTTQFSKLLDEGKKMYEPLGAELVYGRRGDPGPSFNFLSGARIFVCHMEQEQNKEDHQGIEYQYCGFDELTQFSVTQYTYLFSRLRSTIPYLNSRMRATTNPTGSGLMWVKKRFIKTSETIFTPNKVFYFAPDPVQPIEDNPTGVVVNKDNEFARSRMFVPGKLSDNKILNDADPTYKLNIMMLGKKYENALLHGDWDAFGGDFFDDFNSVESKVNAFDIPPEWKLFGSLDPGWSNACAFGLHAVDFNNTVYTLFTTNNKKISPAENARLIKDRIKTFIYTQGRMPEYIISGRDAFAKKDMNAIIATDATFADKFREEGLILQPANTDRINGWMQVKQYMRFGKWKYFEGFCENLIDEIVSAPTGENDPDDIEGKGNDINITDHQLDMLRYGMMSKFVPVHIDDKPLPAWYYEEFEPLEEGVAPSVMSV